MQKIAFFLLLFSISRISGQIIELPATWKIKMGDQAGYALPGFDDSQWQDIPVGQKWQKAGYKNAGYGWYRVHFKLSDSEKLWFRGKEKVLLRLGYIDDVSWIYVNGKLVSTLGTDTPYQTAYYRMHQVELPLKDITIDMEICLAVRVFSPDTFGAGMYAGPYQLYLGEMNDINEFRYWAYSYPAGQTNNMNQGYGLDAMSKPENMPFLYPSGTRTHQFIAADPTGKNGDGDTRTSFTKYIDENGETVIFDAYGPGCLYRQQMNLWLLNDGGLFSDPNAGKSVIKYYFDDEKTPRINMTVDQFFGGHTAPFTAPYCYLDGMSRFAILYYPFAFRKRLKITVNVMKEIKDATWYQYTYLTYPQGTVVESWKDKSQDNILVRKQWTNHGTDPKPSTGNRSVSKAFSIADKKSESFTINGQAAITSIRINVDPYNQHTFYQTKIRIYWDDQKEASVDLPLGYLAGCGGEENFLVAIDIPARTLKTLLMGYAGDSHSFYNYFPMPFWKNARIEFLNETGLTIDSLRCDVTYQTKETYEYPYGQAGYFCTKRTRDYDAEGTKLYSSVFDARGRGHMVALTFYTENYDMDGDEFSYFDDSHTTHIHGNGTEDDHNQGWGGSNHQKPLWGGVLNGYQGAYRIYMNEPYVFNKHLRMNYEHETLGNYKNIKSDVTMFYYLSPLNDTLMLTDELNVGNAISEKEHNYTVSGQTWTGSVTSSYDGYEQNLIWDTCTDDGRAYQAYSQFTMKIEKNNSGVRPRKRINRSANGVQTATVYVDGVKLEKPWHVVQSSYYPPNQAWYDAEYEIPAVVTKGKESIRIKIEAAR